jgi:hypothetical protein
MQLLIIVPNTKDARYESSHTVVRRVLTLFFSYVFCIFRIVSYRCTHICAGMPAGLYIDGLFGREI